MSPIIFDHANKAVVVVNDPVSLRRYQQLVAAQVSIQEHVMAPDNPFKSVPVHHKGKHTVQPAPRMDAEDKRDGGRDEATEKK